jgi:hypothetical protein
MSLHYDFGHPCSVEWFVFLASLLFTFAYKTWKGSNTVAVCSRKVCSLEAGASDSENRMWREEVRGGVSIVPRVMADKSHDVWSVAGDDKEKRYEDVWQ